VYLLRRDACILTEVYSLFGRNLPEDGSSLSLHKSQFFSISNFRLVLNVVFFLLGDSPAYEFYMPTFRNILSHLHRWFKLTPSMKMEKQCSETSA